MAQPTQSHIQEALEKIPSFLADQTYDTWQSTADNEWDINFYVDNSPNVQDMFSVTLYKNKTNNKGQLYTDTSEYYRIPIDLEKQKMYLSMYPKNTTVNRRINIGDLFTVGLSGDGAFVEFHVVFDRNNLEEKSFIDGMISMLLAITPLINWNDVAIDALTDTLSDAICNYDG